MSVERCALCGCQLERSVGGYAEPSPRGRSHATKHHYVAERFFGRSANRPGTKRDPIFSACPWGVEGQTGVFCYECHEEVLHNPVFLPADIEALAALVSRRGLNEGAKGSGRDRVGGRIKLLHDVIEAGIKVMSET